MRTHIAGWTLALAATVTAPAAIAAESGGAAPYPPCDRTPSDAEVAAAKGAFQAGNASFNEADYARAITYWEDAYRRDCTAHPLLLNLARAYELDNQREKAIMALETYVERNPGSTDEDQIDRRIEKLRAQVAQENAATEPEPQPTAPLPATEPEASPPPDEAETSGGRPIWPLFVAGGGIVLSGVGWALYGIASGDVSDFEKQCPNRECGPANDPATRKLIDDANAARSRQTIGVVLGVSGAAIFGAGLVYYLVSDPGGSQSAKRLGPADHVHPWLGPNTAGLSVTGQF